MSGIRKNGSSCLEVYQASLEQRLQQGDRDLVCRDEELYKEVKTYLFECSPQDFCCQLGLDTLSVIETSLCASHRTLGQDRLKRLVKAFEVLELAALNLYLCPWRKEYKVVKTFSGMFTHCIKPALTPQQAKELFALLGYQPGGGNGEELRLTAKPVNSLLLLQLAYAFFTARVECQLLLTAVATTGDSMELVLQLIHERKRGCTFQIALEHAKFKLEPDPCDSPLALNATLDLYTDESLADHGHMASPPSLPYIPPSDDSLTYKMCRSSTSQSNLIQRNKNNAPVTSISSLTYHINATPQKTGLSMTDHVMTRQQQIQSWDVPSKDELKQHSCIKKPSNNFFFVCHDCHYIHDTNCEALNTCCQIYHNVQNTGLLQPAQIEERVTPHPCLKVGSTDYVVCHTCNKSHDYICNEYHSCQTSGHDVIYNETSAKAKPMPLHQCCKFTRPVFACLTCRVFHDVSCDNQCQRLHEVQGLKDVCCTCSNTDIYLLCRYCCAQHCKKCWFKAPLECKCGFPFELSTV